MSGLRHATLDLDGNLSAQLPRHQSQSTDIMNIDLPAHLKEGQYDAMLLYAEADRAKALTFKMIIERFVKLKDGQPPKICTIDESITWIQSRVEHLGEAMKRSTYALLYVTDSFRSDRWSILQKDECLMESIFDTKKPWFAVPVFTDKDQKNGCRSLTGLRGLKGIDLFRLLPRHMMNDADVSALTSNDFDPVILDYITRMLNRELGLRRQREREDDKLINEWLEHKTRLHQEEMTGEQMPETNNNERPASYAETPVPSGGTRAPSGKTPGEMPATVVKTPMMAGKTLVAAELTIVPPVENTVQAVKTPGLGVETTALAAETPVRGVENHVQGVEIPLGWLLKHLRWLWRPLHQGPHV